jgi:hypothetical protein
MDIFHRGPGVELAQFMILPRSRHDINFRSYVEVDKAYNPTCPASVRLERPSL